MIRQHAILPTDPIVKTLGTMYSSFPLDSTLDPSVIQNVNIDLTPVAPFEKSVFRPSMAESLLIALKEGERDVQKDGKIAGLSPELVVNFPNWKVPISEVIPDNQNIIPFKQGQPSWQGFPVTRSDYRVDLGKPVIKKATLLRTNRLY